MEGYNEIVSTPLVDDASSTLMVLLVVLGSSNVNGGINGNDSAKHNHKNVKWKY